MEFYMVGVKMDRRAKVLLDRLATEQNLPTNEMCLRLIMSHPEIDRPDLTKVPRKMMGRPRKILVA